MVATKLILYLVTGNQQVNEYLWTDILIALGFKFSWIDGLRDENTSLDMCRTCLSILERLGTDFFRCSNISTVSRVMVLTLELSALMFS